MQTTFDAPGGTDPVALDLGSMGKGQAWVNGHHLGRYWLLLAPKSGCSTCDYRGAYNPDRCRTNCGEPSQRWQVIMILLLVQQLVFVPLDHLRNYVIQSHRIAFHGYMQELAFLALSIIFVLDMVMAIQVPHSSSLVTTLWELVGALRRGWRWCIKNLFGHKICTCGVFSRWWVPTSTSSILVCWPVDGGITWSRGGAAWMCSWPAYNPRQVCELWEPTRLLWSLPSGEVPRHGKLGSCKQGKSGNVSSDPAFDLLTYQQCFIKDSLQQFSICICQDKFLYDTFSG